MSASTVPTIDSTTTGDSARVRRSDPATSHAAADSISALALEDREREVLRIPRDASKPRSMQEIENIHERRSWRGEVEIHYSGSSIRTALKQLVTKGRVICDGVTRTESGRRAQTWRLTKEMTA